jgi:GNAT superfamily N-acetyltransferase
MTEPSLHERYLVVPLASRHDRDAFSCGIDALDRYLRQQASQDARRRVATTFVAEDLATAAVHGFYSLSMASVLLEKLPESLARKMPRYPTVPAVRLGRLAVHLDVKGTGLGAHLLVDAMKRALASEIAWTAFLVDAKEERARSFYEKYGFRSFAHDLNHLFLMRATIEQGVSHP